MKSFVKCKVYLILLILSLNKIVVSQNDEPKMASSGHTVPIVTCGTRIAKNNLKGIVSFVTYASEIPDYEFENERQTLLKKLHETENAIENIRLPASPDLYPRLGTATKNYVVFGRNLTTILEIFSHLTLLRSWDSRAKFLLIVFEHFPMNSLNDEVIKLKQELWKKWIYNIVVIATEDQTYETYKILTWFPYNNGMCGYNQFELNVLGFCGIHMSSFDMNLYPHKIPDNFNGCKMKVTTHIWPIFVLAPTVIAPRGTKQNLTEGLEIYFLNMFAKRVNVTLEYRLHKRDEHWGDVLPNKTTTGMLSNLATGEADLVIGGYLQSSSRVSLYDMTTQFYYDEVNFVVPQAEIVERWKSLTRNFRYRVWICLLTSLVIGPFVWHFFKSSVTGQPHTFSEISHSYLQQWSLIFVIPVRYNPPQTILRLVFLSWVSCTFLLSAAYQTSLISVLTQPDYKEQISTISDMIRENYNFSLSGTVYGFVKMWQHETEFKQILERTTPCAPMLECLRSLTNTTHHATLASRSFYTYESWRFKDKSGKPTLYVFTSKIVLYITVMYMTKGFPLKQRINNLITRTMEAGLLEYWSQKLALEADEQEDEEEVAAVTTGPIALQLDHLQGVYYVLLVGWVLSATVFFIELSNRKCCRRVFGTCCHQNTLNINKLSPGKINQYENIRKHPFPYID